MLIWVLDQALIGPQVPRTAALVPETLKVLCLCYTPFLLFSYPSLEEDIVLAPGLDVVRKQPASKT